MHITLVRSMLEIHFLETLPPAGRLKYFVQNWKKITQDRTILDIVTRKCYAWHTTQTGKKWSQTKNCAGTTFCVIENKSTSNKLAGHCLQYPEEKASNLVLWQPGWGRRNRGRQRITYYDTLVKDTGLENCEELQKAMRDREGWKERSYMARVGTRP